LAGGTVSLAAGIGRLQVGAGTAAPGADRLRVGLGRLSAAGSQLASGVGRLAVGGSRLASGLAGATGHLPGFVRLLQAHRADVVPTSSAPLASRSAFGFPGPSPSARTAGLVLGPWALALVAAGVLRRRFALARLLATPALVGLLTTAGLLTLAAGSGTARPSPASAWGFSLWAVALFLSVHHLMARRGAARLRQRA
ncbi:MAG: hypothetical protein ACYCZV_14285, partial [Acidimicrobiales bacterium]